MKERDPSKRLCTSEIELDRLSSLPGHIICRILLHLPIRDAIRTSLLSTRWRYKWVTLPNLVFDDQCFSLEDRAVGDTRLVDIVDHVLLFHTGPIYKFELSHGDLIRCTEIDRWIVHLSRSPIRELVINIRTGGLNKLHSCFYSYKNLTHLELVNCLLTPPPTFQGFKNLKSLFLQYAMMRQDVFENLISSCPLLERLTLMNCHGFEHLNIDAPNLLFIDIDGRYDDVTFTNTFQLALVSICLYTRAGISKRPLNTRSLLKFFSQLPHIQRLKIRHQFLKYLATGDVPSRLPNLCVYLGYLSIHINFDDWEENKAALCLLRSSPNLQELEILFPREFKQACHEERSTIESCANIWEDEHQGGLFNRLQLVKVSGISGTRLELGCISFLLLASPVLERMTIQPVYTSRGRPMMMKDLLRFRRASAQAEIVYLDL